LLASRKCAADVNRAIKVLLQTTIPATTDDWSIARFSLLANYLREQRDDSGQPMFDVVTRDRDPPGAADLVLSRLDQSDFDEMWLFAVDIGDGLTDDDCRAISNFRRLGRGLMVTRDHMDLGSSIARLKELARRTTSTAKTSTRTLERGTIRTPQISPGPIFTQGQTATIRSSSSEERSIRCSRIPHRLPGRFGICRRILTKGR
jgi:hypothetical protein